MSSRTGFSPFIPGSDDVPSVWAGRSAELADWQAVRTRRLAGVYERGRAVLGEFGIGKSVLVNRIASEATAAGDLVTPQMRIPVGVDAMALLADGLRRLAADHSLDGRIGDRATTLMNRIEEIRLPVVGGGLSTRQPVDPLPHRAVGQLMVHLGRIAREDGRLLVIRLDEIQNIEVPNGLSQILTVLGDALNESLVEHDVAGIRREPKLPIVVYLSGLPDFRRRAADSGATFSRRFKLFDLDPLSDSELRGALAPFTTTGWPILTDQGPAHVHLDPGAIDLLVDHSMGDPFVFQLAGEAMWNAGTGLVVTHEEATRGWNAARREIRSVVVGRLEGLTDLQMRYLTAAAEERDDDRRTAGVVANAIGYDTSTQAASTAHALDVERGLIRREAGRITFRSPSVQAYLRGDWP